MRRRDPTTEDLFSGKLWRQVWNGLQTAFPFSRAGFLRMWQRISLNAARYLFSMRRERGYILLGRKSRSPRNYGVRKSVISSMQTAAE